MRATKRSNVHLCAHNMRGATRVEKSCRVASAAKVVDDVFVIAVESDSALSAEICGDWRIIRVPRWPHAGGTVLRKVCRTLTWTVAVLARSEWKNATCVNAHSVAVLPLAMLMKAYAGCRVIYDAHELETECPTGNVHRVIFRLIEQLFIRRADAVVVVSDSIADWYAQKYGIERPTVVRNIPEVLGAAPIAAPSLWRDRFGIGSDEMVFILQGKLTRGRRVEQLLRVFAGSRSDRHLVVMGFGDLTDEVKSAALRCRNIHFADAVLPSEILAHTAGADVGIHGGENICLSYYYSLPNKFFEYLWAGLGVMVPDWPEVGRIVTEEKVGWIVRGESDEAWIHAVNGLTWEEVRRAQVAARIAAPRYSWETEACALSAVYQRCFSRNEADQPTVTSTE